MGGSTVLTINQNILTQTSWHRRETIYNSPTVPPVEYVEFSDAHLVEIIQIDPG